MAAFFAFKIKRVATLLRQTKKLSEVYREVRKHQDDFTKKNNITQKETSQAVCKAPVCITETTEFKIDLSKRTLFYKHTKKCLLFTGLAVNFDILDLISYLRLHIIDVKFEELKGVSLSNCADLDEEEDIKNAKSSKQDSDTDKVSKAPRTGKEQFTAEVDLKSQFRIKITGGSLGDVIELVTQCTKSYVNMKKEQLK